MRRRVVRRPRRNPSPPHLRVVGGSTPSRSVAPAEWQFEVRGVLFRAVVSPDATVAVRMKINGHAPIVARGRIAADGGAQLRFSETFAEIQPSDVSARDLAYEVSESVNAALWTPSRGGRIAPREQHRWEERRRQGDRYVSGRKTAEITRKIVADLKGLVHRGVLPRGTKFGQRTVRDRISVTVTDTPIVVLSSAWAQRAVAGCARYAGASHRYTPRAQEMLEILRAVAARYNRETSHSQSDYYNYEFNFTAGFSRELEDRDFKAATGMSIDDRSIPW